MNGLDLTNEIYHFTPVLDGCISFSLKLLLSYEVNSNDFLLFPSFLSSCTVAPLSDVGKIESITLSYPWTEENGISFNQIEIFFNGTLYEFYCGCLLGYEVDGLYDIELTRIFSFDQ